MKRKRDLIEISDSEEEEESEESDEISSSEEENNIERDTELFGSRDFSNLKLKEDFLNRPLYVLETGKIFLETFSPIYKPASDFVTAISEPTSRPANVHEYQITQYSLYAAVSVGLTTEDIILVLERLCKTELPSKLVRFIKSCTSTFGKAKLVLYKNRCYIESSDKKILKKFLKNEFVFDCLIQHLNEPNIQYSNQDSPTKSQDLEEKSSSKGKEKSKKKKKTKEKIDYEKYIQESEIFAQSFDKEINIDPLLLNEERNVQENNQVVNNKFFRFEVEREKVQELKKKFLSMGYPILEEYEFRNDVLNENLDIHLKPSTKIRHYQERALNKMFGAGRARSGVIVLPCGAGKTLVGVTASCTIKKNVLVLCTSNVSVEQWKQQFKLWTDITDDKIAKLTSDTKDKTQIAGLTITTYSMIAYSGKRSQKSERLMEQLKSIEWGLMILDEVHVVPAQTFSKVLGLTAAHCKLGPKLYEANWLDLQKDKFIAKVLCAEVWCPITSEFFNESLKSKANSRNQLLFAMNPKKIQYCQFLLNYHEARGDKIIVFSDNIFALKKYSKIFARDCIYGQTSNNERQRILSSFQNNPRTKTIFLSKVGDTSIDLPEANVIIQISSHFGSRRQEAQRLGRILRPKEQDENEHNAFFYSLVSKDTQEMYFSTKRQQFLIDQGYSFKILTELVDKNEEKDYFYFEKNEQLNLLEEILSQNQNQNFQEEKIKVSPFEIFNSFDNDSDDDDESQNERPLKIRRKVSSVSALSGGDDFVYEEFQI